MSGAKYSDDQVLNYIVLRQAGASVVSATTTLGVPEGANGALRDRAYKLGLTTPEEMADIAKSLKEG